MKLRRLKRTLNDVLFLLFCAVIVAAVVYLSYEAWRWFILFVVAGQ